ncbi:MAG: hypothetical protein H6720_23295, partial [Sandaracinus sp.]|nr:hypothetical protein [Sandaracinus sp.]
KQADEGEPRAICLTLDTILDGTEHMHADLQRRFLRALADSVARQHGAI